MGQSGDETLKLAKGALLNRDQLSVVMWFKLGQIQSVTFVSKSELVRCMLRRLMNKWLQISFNPKRGPSRVSSCEILPWTNFWAEIGK